jgi:cytosine/adenosine deaminase-related metal-dependent hydrolase
MSYKYKFVLKNGTVVDPANQRNGVMDIAVAGDQIAEVAEEIDPTLARDCFDVTGKLIFPGIIDLHVHASAWLGGKFGHKMMALAGVTTALDMSGPINSVLDIAKDYGVGLNLACLQYLRPGHTVKNTDPDRTELEQLLQESLQCGAYGLKILGGHYPLTPEATARAIEVAHNNDAYLAFHAGTLETKSNIDGFHEAIDLIRDHPVHLAHINSYCRGTVRPYMAETEEAIEALTQHPNICSESYLSPVNGTSAKCSSKGPESRVTVMCLETGGFPATEQGLEEAIWAGWAQINLESGGQIILATGEQAVKWWRRHGTDTTVSFRVNPEMPKLRLASAKRDGGDFVVDCISTDGGGIPRNVSVEMGLALVKLQVLSVDEFAVKTSLNPAKILGLKNKGHLGPGSDADISVLDLATQKPVLSLAGGEVIMWHGFVCGRGTRVVTTPAGQDRIKEKGLLPIVVDPVDTPPCRRG